MSALTELLAELEAEQAGLDAAVADLTADGWTTPTPAAGWDIRDQIWHLAYFDDAATRAAGDPEGFGDEIRESNADTDAFAQRIVDRGRTLSPPDVLAAWRDNRSRFHEVVGALDPSARLSWYGLPMSVRSLVTARLMETWAHGMDVLDALGVDPEPTDRLRHVAYLGCRSLPFSFQINGLPVPEEAVRVELVLPSGERFEYGPEGAANRVRGAVADFSLVVTQRRHPADVDLDVHGDVAETWVTVAQAFAGPPGGGRQPVRR
jgi:uncharacterized protein (TIGR03084 family)